MRSPAREIEPGVQQDRRGVWGNLMVLASLVKWLVTLIQLTEEEQQQAGVRIKHQGYE